MSTTTVPDETRDTRPIEPRDTRDVPTSTIGGINGPADGPTDTRVLMPPGPHCDPAWEPCATTTTVLVDTGAPPLPATGAADALLVVGTVLVVIGAMFARVRR